jgi:hypothetical protein
VRLLLPAQQARNTIDELLIAAGWRPCVVSDVNMRTIVGAVDSGLDKKTNSRFQPATNLARIMRRKIR